MGKWCGRMGRGIFPVSDFGKAAIPAPNPVTGPVLKNANNASLSLTKVG